MLTILFILIGKFCLSVAVLQKTYCLCVSKYTERSLHSQMDNAVWQTLRLRYAQDSLAGSLRVGQQPIRTHCVSRLLCKPDVFCKT